MRTEASEDPLVTLLRESFDADTRSLTAPVDLPGAVRRRLRRRRIAAAASAGGVLTAAASLAAATLFTVGQHDTSPPVAQQEGPTKIVRLSAFDFRVPANAKVTQTCLPVSDDDLDRPAPLGEVFQLVINRRGNIVTDAAGNGCVGATFGYTTSPPTATRALTQAGQRTVYLATAGTTTRSGYIWLDARASNAAAAVTGGRAGHYALVMTIPADEDQTVLAAGLRQYPQPGSAPRRIAASSHAVQQRNSR